MRNVYFIFFFLTFSFSSMVSNSQLIISEFRLRGPNGANDEYIEIYNNSGFDHTVAGGGTGYAIVASNGVARGIIPNGTVIPNHGHYLFVNSVGYSLASYPAGNGTTATGDATYTTDIPDNAGIALFNTSISANFTLANRMDAVGSISEANSLYKEGGGYPAIVPFSIDYCFHRKEEVGPPQDSNNNAADFKFEDTNGTSAGAGQRLGAPGPQNLSSPLTGGGLVVAILDPAAPAASAPNFVRDFTSDPPNNSTFGTMDVRLRVTNNTGGNVTRLRVRISDLTTFPSPSGITDLRPRTSTSLVVSTSMGNVTVNGTTLEQPPSQPNGGGNNSSLSNGTITLATPLANGATTYIRMLFGIQQTGLVNIGFFLEALPGGGSGAAGSGVGAPSPVRIGGTDGFIYFNPVLAGEGDLVINEFRTRGPNGANDEFVEIHNTTNNPIVVWATDGSVGHILAASDGSIRFVIPNGTVIRPRGYYLASNSNGYSLNAYQEGFSSVTYTNDIPDNAGIALFKTGNSANFNLANRLDAVGSTSEANTLYKEGAGYTALNPLSIDQTLYRKTHTGQSQDSDNNSEDFKFEDTNGSFAGPPQSLGAPGPQGEGSPVRAGSSILIEVADPVAAGDVAPNLGFDPTSLPLDNSSFGTISVRYKITNTGAVAIYNLRLRIDSINTFPSSAGIADLRGKSSGDIIVATSGGPIQVRGTTLNQPPSQPNGGGFNSSFDVPSVDAASRLMPGQSIYVQLQFGIQQNGEYNIHVSAEVEPYDGSTPDAPFVTRGITCPTITVTNPAVTTGTSGSAFSQTFTHSGGALPVTFTTVSALPAGLSLDPVTGVLSGTPTTSGSFPIVVTVTDANSCTGIGASYNLVISDPPCGAGPAQTFTNNTAVAIPTGPGVVSSTILVSGAPRYIYDVNAITNILHSFNADIDFTITSPEGTVVTLSSDNGGANDNVFNGTTWDDDANPLGQVPYTANSGLVGDHTYTNNTVATPLVPEEPLGAFIGENPNGVWTITISDDLAGDGGTLSSWSLVIGGNYVPPTISNTSVTNNTPVAISAVGTSTVSSTINIAGAGTSIADVNVLTSLVHTFAGDIDMTLMSPAGTVVTLTTDNGAGSDNVFNGTTWDDSANPAGSLPYTSNNGLVSDHLYVNNTVATLLTPEEALAAFIGENPNGTWTLSISDDAGGDGGSLDSWTLNIQTSTCAPPTCTITCPANIVVNNSPGICGAIVNYPAIAGAGTCGAITASPASGSLFPVGTTLVTVNSATGFGFCTFTVTVTDSEVPTITCPANITAPNAAGLCSANVVTPDPTMNDNCTITTLTWTLTGATVATSPAAGINNIGARSFNVGVTTVTYTATDEGGNSASCSYTVTVNDTQSPTITCPANVTANNAPGLCSASVATPDPTTSDNCVVTLLGWDLTGATTGSSPITGINNLGTETFNVGVTTVTYIVGDAAGNTSTCSFTVTVNDTELPVINCPANITATTPVGSCFAVVNYTVTASDNCPGVTTAIQSGLNSGASFPIGVNTVTWSATDASGNISTCSFTVTVIDGQLPVISVQPQKVTSCVGRNVTFSVTSTNASSYQWQMFSGGTWNDISGATGPAYTVNNVTTAMNTNTFRVNVIGLCSVVSSAHATLFVNTNPVITLTATGPTSMLPGQLTTITATGIPPGGSFAWLLNGVIIPGVTGNMLSGLSVDDIGSYQVRYTDPNGCITTSAALELTGLASGNLWVYPNPNPGQFHVRFFNQDNEPATVNVYDAKGAKVYSRRVTTGLTYTDIDIDLGPVVVSGVYMVELVDGSGKRVGGRQVIVRHQ